MVNLNKISGIGDWTKSDEKYRVQAESVQAGKVFLVEHKNTIELRCDERLSETLREQYESVMESRYFGHGGIEIVLSGQLSESEIEDLIRLSYNLSTSR